LNCLSRLARYNAMRYRPTSPMTRRFASFCAAIFLGLFVFSGQTQAHNTEFSKFSQIENRTLSPTLCASADVVEIEDQTFDLGLIESTEFESLSPEILDLLFFEKQFEILVSKLKIFPWIHEWILTIRTTGPPTLS
jgi:hypothetical protein